MLLDEDCDELLLLFVVLLDEEEDDEFEDDEEEDTVFEEEDDEFVLLLDDEFVVLLELLLDEAEEDDEFVEDDEDDCELTVCDELLDDRSVTFTVYMPFAEKAADQPMMSPESRSTSKLNSSTIQGHWMYWESSIYRKTVMSLPSRIWPAPLPQAGRPGSHLPSILPLASRTPWRRRV